MIKVVFACKRLLFSGKRPAKLFISPAASIICCLFYNLNGVFYDTISRAPISFYARRNSETYLLTDNKELSLIVSNRVSVAHLRMGLTFQLPLQQTRSLSTTLYVVGYEGKKNRAIIDSFTFQSGFMISEIRHACVVLVLLVTRLA